VNRKPNSNSALKTLPPERQAAIAEYCRDHSLRNTAKWLADDGITTSIPALSEWFSWWKLAQRAEDRARKVDAFLIEEKSLHPELTEVQLFDRGQRLFSMIAMAEEDAKNWTALQTVSLKRGLLQLDREKFQTLAAEKMLDKRLRQAADEINNRNDLTRAEKIAAMRKAAFSDVDALEASGEIELPA
jgi:hypothetical protein